jgi:hypothetical protein
MHIHFEEITLFIHRILFLLLVNILQSVIALSASSLSLQRLYTQDDTDRHTHTHTHTHTQ